MILKVSLPESNVADVVVVSSVDADNPTKQLRVAITAILTVRGNIMEQKLDQSLPVFRKLDIVDNINNNMPYFMNFHVRDEATISLPPSPPPVSPPPDQLRKEASAEVLPQVEVASTISKRFLICLICEKLECFSSRWKYCQNNYLFSVTDSIERICLMTWQRDQVLYQSHRIFVPALFL